MGDRTFASIRIGGHVDTVEKIEKLCEAIYEEGLCNNADEAKSEIRQAIETKASHLYFDHNEVNYGVFDYIDACAQEIGIACCTEFDAGGEYTAGCKTIMPDGSEHHCERGIPFRELTKARKEDDPLAAIDKLIEDHMVASGERLPPFTVSPAVAAWLKIFGEKAA